jgi:hypothetical protein
MKRKVVPARWLATDALYCGSPVFGLYALGILALRQGDFVQATASLMESLALRRKRKNRRVLLSSSIGLVKEPMDKVISRERATTMRKVCTFFGA